jgi:hypothetical protein
MQAHGVKRRRRNSKGCGKRSPKLRAHQVFVEVPECKLAAPTMALPRLKLPQVPTNQRGICACDAMTWLVLVALLFASPMS